MRLSDLLIEDDDSGNATTTTPTEAKRQETSVTTANETPDTDLPEKFRGKTRKDIVEMYSNLEGLHGRMANELGTQRMLTDQLLGLRDRPAEAKREPPVTANDLLERPQETLERTIDSRVEAALRPLRQESANLRALGAKSEFERRHPDYQNTVNDSDFTSWVKSSPLRLRAAKHANEGDWTIADELFTEYEAGRARKGSSEDDNLGNARRASLTGGGSAGGGSTGDFEKPRGKIYSRAALMRMNVEDPEGYADEDFQAEVMKAYAEGRVK